MMSKHSKTYEDKKAELAELEKGLREVIDEESKGMEKSIVQILKIAAIASTAVLVGYGVYRWTRGTSEEENEEDKPKKESKFFDKVVDKVTDVVTGLVVQNITTYLDKLKEEVTPPKR
jgi:predicted metal-dependent phosphotriesterase family hydrolase